MVGVIVPGHKRMAPLWFIAMDSVGKTAGSGASRWYISDVTEILKNDAQLKVEQEIGAGFQRLAEITAGSEAWVRQADIVWVISLANDLIQACGRNEQECDWRLTFPVISASFSSMALQFGHQPHAIVFGGSPEMWDIEEPHVFNARAEQVMLEGRRLGLNMIDARAWVEDTQKAYWRGFHLNN